MIRLNMNNNTSTIFFESIFNDFFEFNNISFNIIFNKLFHLRNINIIHNIRNKKNNNGGYNRGF